MKGRPFAPEGDAFSRATAWWKSVASDADAVYDDDVEIKAGELTPIVTSSSRRVVS
jgi:3-isopropylmalate/(R)-2-methylmalate dehydratase large subunit